VIDTLQHCTAWFRAYYNSYLIPLAIWPGLWRRIESRQHQSKSTSPGWVNRHGAQPLFRYLRDFAPDVVIATEVGTCELAAMYKRESPASFLLVGLPLAVWEVAKRRAVAAGLIALALFLGTGVPAYGIAWWKTGNPIFPFRNEKIHSPLLDPAVSFQDNEFRQPLTWTTPFDLAFRTHSFYEGQNGTLGFQYTLFLPLGLLAVFLARSRRAAGSLAIAVGAAILILRSEPNARYLYAAMPLLFVPFGALLAWLQAHRRLYGTMLVLAGLCGALNLYFLPGSGWYHKDFYMRSPFSQRGRERYARDYIPIRPAIQQFNLAHPGANLFLANDEDVADPLGEVYEGGWHQYNRLLELRKARTLTAMVALFEKWGVHYFTSRKAEPGEQRDPAILGEFLEKCSVLEYQVDQIRVSRLELAACGIIGPTHAGQ